MHLLSHAVQVSILCVRTSCGSSGSGSGGDGGGRSVQMQGERAVLGLQESVRVEFIENSTGINEQLEV